MNLFKKITLFTVIALFANLTNQAHAAVQGTLGATSFASKIISVSVLARVQIANIADVAFGSWSSGDGDLLDNDEVCIYSNAASGGYNVTATSLDGTGVFTLDSAGTNLTYGVAWTGATGGTFAGGTALTEGALNSTLFSGSTTSVTCAGGDNATLSIQILAADLDAVTGTATAFSDTLTITISPV
jgi:hypothetical protein